MRVSAPNQDIMRPGIWLVRHCLFLQCVSSTLNCATDRIHYSRSIIVGNERHRRGVTKLPGDCLGVLTDHQFTSAVETALFLFQIIVQRKNPSQGGKDLPVW